MTLLADTAFAEWPSSLSLCAEYRPVLACHCECPKYMCSSEGNNESRSTGRFSETSRAWQHFSDNALRTDKYLSHFGNVLQFWECLAISLNC